MSNSQAYYPADKTLQSMRTAGQGSSSRPCTNTSVSDYRSSGFSNKPNPIKHWRRQLVPRAKSGSSSRRVYIPFNRPGSTATTPIQPTSHVPIPTCEITRPSVDPSVTNIFYQDPNKPDLHFYRKDNSTQNSGKLFYNTIDAPPTSKCLDCNPENNLIRPTFGSQTKRINPVRLPGTDSSDEKYTTIPYSFDTRSYLRSKQKSYETNLSGNQIPSIQYSRLTTNCCVKPLPPDSDPSKSSGTRQSLYRSQLNINKSNGRSECCKLTYKPSNAKFSQQGAVSSSTRMERLKLNTVRSTKQTSPFTSNWAMQAENSGVYRYNGVGAYYIKNKPYTCRPSDYTLMSGSLMFPGTKRQCGKYNNRRRSDQAVLTPL